MSGPVKLASWQSGAIPGSIGVAMAPLKECPMCGEAMRLDTRERTERIPGTGAARTSVLHEWICPECDYFEEADEEEPRR